MEIPARDNYRYASLWDNRLFYITCRAFTLARDSPGAGICLFGLGDSRTPPGIPQSNFSRRKVTLRYAAEGRVNEDPRQPRALKSLP
jgi:hypothetical protein